MDGDFVIVALFNWLSYSGDTGIATSFDNKIEVLYEVTITSNEVRFKTRCREVSRGYLGYKIQLILKGFIKSFQ